MLDKPKLLVLPEPRSLEQDPSVDVILQRSQTPVLVSAVLSSFAAGLGH